MPSTSAAASAAIPRPAISGDDVEMGNEVGDAKILNNLSEAFTIDGLFDHINDEAAWDGPDEGEEMEEDDGAAAWEAEEAAEDLAAAQSVYIGTNESCLVLTL
jgi:nuclear GTP-binding protein